MKQKIKFRTTAVLLLFNLLVALGVFAVHRGPVISNLENAFVDLRYWLRGVAAPDPRVCIVAIDNPSIRELGLFPWPRRRHAQLIDTLTSAGAHSIAFDLFFSERDPDHPADDAVLGQAASSSGRVVFAGMFNRSTDGQPADPVLPVLDLQHDNVGVGLVNIFPEKDGATRRAPLWVRHNDAFIPSFALAAWSAAEGKPPEDWVARSHPPIDGSSAWNEACINYTYWRDDEKTRSPFPYYSYVDVITGRVAPSTFAGRIVLVGATAPGLYDAKSAPGAPVIYGIEIHANVLNNILRNNFLKAQATSGPVLWSILSLFAVAAWLLMSRSSSFVGGASAVAVLVGYFYVCHLAFRQDVWLPYAAPMTTFLLAYFSGLGYRLFVADRDREKIKNTWSRYMSPKLVDLLVEGQTVPTAGHREVTVFFSDLAKFTSLSEQLPPSELVELLNLYFSMMTDILFKYDITFDKYIGDAIMGYGNAPLDQPDHAAQACRAALAQRAALPALNKKF
ncbi:MAG: adenylate/guanylate cyclase domain-containing protein, partial [Elusimicrobia bacterium]|nr:adenylate/guanylate cyclase domain-containing protein [Elusimicrobiota bacterium]